MLNDIIAFTKNLLTLSISYVGESNLGYCSKNFKTRLFNNISIYDGNFFFLCCISMRNNKRAKIIQIAFKGYFLKFF